MKKLISLLLLAMMLCVPVLAEGEISIAATSYPLYDMAKNVCGEYAEVSYVPDAQIPEGTQIVLCMADEVADAGDATVVRAIDNVSPTLELIEGDTSTLTVPINNAMVANAFCGVLQGLDADHSTDYSNNYSEYANAIFALDSEFRGVIPAGLKVSCADGASMAYFAQEYGVEYAQDAENAVALYSYEHPEEEDLETPYIDLMRRNYDILAELAASAEAEEAAEPAEAEVSAEPAEAEEAAELAAAE